MFCSKCNSELPNGAKFCVSCGEPVKTKKFCKKCGNELLDNMKFCVVCGTRIEDAPAAVQPVSAPKAAPQMNSVQPVSAPKAAPQMNSVQPVSAPKAAPQMDSVQPVSAPKAAPQMDSVQPVSAPKAAPQMDSVQPVSAPKTVPQMDTVQPVSAPKAAATATAEPEFDDFDGDFEIPVIAPVINEEPAPSFDSFGGFDINSPVSAAKPTEKVEEKPKATAPTPAPAPVPTAKPVFSGNPYASSAPKNAPSFAGPSDSALHSGYVPPYDPSKTAQSPTVVSNAPAAVAVKRKSPAKPILITVAILLVVALLAGLIFFFTNKATFLSTFMGKTNYAAMVEGNWIKQLAEKIDTGNVSGQIKNTSELYASLANIVEIPEIPDDSGLMSMSERLSSESDSNTVNLSAFFAALSGSLKQNYGANSVVVSLGANVELTDTAKTELKKSLDMSDENLNQLIEYINGTKLSAGVSASDSAAAFKAEANIKDLKLNVKVMFNSKGDAYIVLPFASEKAFMVKIEDAANGSVEFPETNDVPALSLDEKEIERLLNELVALYIEDYKSAKIEMENGSLSVAGVNASGKLITAVFDSDKLEKLFSDIGEKLASDSYFKKTVVEYLKKCGLDVSEDDYKNAIKDAFDKAEFKSGAEMTISTLINNSGDVLAKSIKASEDGRSYTKISYASVGKDLGFEVKTEEKTVISASVAGESKTAGTATIKMNAGEDKNVTVKVKYSDVKTEKFCGKYISVGKYEISAALPEDFSDENKLPSNAAEIIADTKLVLSTSVSGSTCTSSFGVESGKFGKVSLSYSVTAESNTTDLNEPSSVIDLTPYIDGDTEPSKEIKDEIIAFFEDIRSAVANQNGGELGNTITDSLDKVISAAKQASSEDVGNLLNSVVGSANAIAGYNKTYNVYNSALTKQANELYNKYYKLYQKLSKIHNSEEALSYEEFEELKSEFNALETERRALERSYKVAAGIIPDYQKLNPQQIVSVLGEFKTALSGYSDDSEKMKKIEANSELKALYESCSAAYTTAFNDALTSYREYVKNGKADAELLAASRKSLETLASLFEDFENKFNM